MSAWKINIADVPEERQEWSWETGRYERYRRHISVALGNDPDGSHPFDLELTRLAPGAKPCPVHAHSHRWELFIIVSGVGEVYRNGDTFSVTAGDCFMQPACTKHRLRNASDAEELLYYIVANEHEEDSGKRHLP